MFTNPIGVASLSKREATRFLSMFGQTILPPLVSTVLFLYVFGVALGNRIDFSEMSLSYLEFIVPGLMTMYLISSSYENTSSSLFIARWHNHIQEILLSPLSYFEMVIGLLSGGVFRGFLVCMSVYAVSSFFVQILPAHFFLLLYFIITISIIFSCIGLLAALWAEDFGMLNRWHIYLIGPLVFLGGVFHPIYMLPSKLQILSQFNPIFYLVQGIRFSLTGVSDISVWMSAAVAFFMAGIFFLCTVYLFKIGYKLRT